MASVRNLKLLATTKHLRSLLILLAGLAAALPATGCRVARDNQIDILERELRAQEDYIYELEDYVVEYSEKLRECRCSQPQMAALTNSDNEPKLAAPRPSDLSRSARGEDSYESKKESSRKSQPEPIETAPAVEEREESFEELEAPDLDLEIGEPLSSEEMPEATPLAMAADDESEENYEAATTATGITIPDPQEFQVALMEENIESDESTNDVSESPDANATDDEPIDQYGELFDEESPEVSHEPELLVVTHVFKGQEKDANLDSLLAVVEARDARNEPADFNGKVSLMVMTSDPDSPERIKRWDFTPEETNAAWQTSHLGDGLHLELPLEETRFPEESCELWVRLETADGRKLLAQVPFEAETLARLEDAEEQLASEADNRDVELAEANPLRSRNSSRTSPVPQRGTESQVKSDPQWRAATHFSSGTNSGFATTASSQKWTTTSLPRTTRNSESTPATASSKQQWKARK